VKRGRIPHRDEDFACASRELLGTRQSGDPPDMRLADLAAHADLVRSPVTMPARCLRAIPTDERPAVLL